MKNVFLMFLLSLFCGFIAVELWTGKACAQPAPARFVDNGDGTVTDNQTGLMWEKKQPSGGVQDKSNPHNVDNLYTWSDSLEDPDGTAFTDFLHKLNNTCNGLGATQCTADKDCSGGVCGFAGYRDWRLPEVNKDRGKAELETIVDFTKGYCGGGSGACIDPIFGPTAASFYWSSVTFGSLPGIAWNIFFVTGKISNSSKGNLGYVRAVRTGQ